MGNTGPTIVHIVDAVIGDFTISSTFEPGSLADALFDAGNMTNVLDALSENDFDTINDVSNEWTLFLPNDDVLTDPDDFDFNVHVYSVTALDSDSLTGMVGMTLEMDSGDEFAVGGAAGEQQTIGGKTINEDIPQNADREESIVYILR